MRFLADENFDQPIIDVLREAGFDVIGIPQKGIGFKDIQIIQLAQSEKCILLTGDKDFGELVFRQKKVTHGVVLVRLSGLSIEEKSDLVRNALAQHKDELEGCFTVISKKLVRIRKSF